MKAILTDKFLEFYETVSQRFFELMVNLLAMISVARNFDLPAFGIFSYLVALLHLATFLAEAGICDRLRNRTAQTTNNQADLHNSAAALFLTGIITVIFFLLVLSFKISHSSIDGSIISYLIIAVIVPLRNSNHLKTTFLHITGQHRDASRILIKKQVLFLFFIWVISLVSLPSLLVSAFLFSEIYQRVVLRKKVGMPKLFQPSFITKGIDTVKRSLRHLFSGEALNLIFHTDLFILGLFVTSYQLGVYAEAALFGRFFLLVPTGIRPILHRYFARQITAGDAYVFSNSFHNVRAYIFYFHALLAMILTIFFNDVIHIFLKFYGSEKLSYDLFMILLPGFLFYAAAVVNETAMEASGNAPFLSRISIIIITINVILSFYLVPFAGPKGAALASLFCLLIYFFIICAIRITSFSRIPILEFLAAGASVYVLVKLIVWLNFSLFLVIITTPPVLYLIFYLLNFFNFDNYDTIERPD